MVISCRGKRQRSAALLWWPARASLRAREVTGVSTDATVGLVGLHIIHKTVTQPQRISTTFEQVDNVPPASPPTFNSSSCTCTIAIPQSCLNRVPGPLYRNCAVGQAQDSTCTPNTPPPNLTISNSLSINTVLETHVQKKTCLSCHIYARIAAGTYVSDFSFMLGNAPSASKTLTARRRTLPDGLLPSLRHP